MRRSFRWLACSGLAMLALHGCSGLCVSRVDPKAPQKDGPVGERISLPIPVFRVLPKADGTVGVDRMELPDPANTFALHGWSFIARHQLNIKTEKGILTEVRWAPDTSAVAAQAFKSAGAVAGEFAKTAAEADKAKEAEAHTDEKAKVEAKKKAKKAHDDAVRAAQLEVTKAKNVLDKRQQELDKATSSGDADKIAAAQAAVDDAEIDLANAEATLAAAVNAPLGPFNAPGARWLPATWIPGPILFAIEESGEPGHESVRLVPVSEQQRMVSRCEFSHPVPVTVTRPATGDLAGYVTFQCNFKSIKGYDLVEAVTFKAAKASVKSFTVRASDDQVLEFVIDKALPPGHYNLSADVETSSGLVRSLLIVLTVP